MENNGIEGSGDARHSVLRFTLEVFFVTVCVESIGIPATLNIPNILILTQPNSSVVLFYFFTTCTEVN